MRSEIAERLVYTKRQVSYLHRAEAVTLIR